MNTHSLCMPLLNIMKPLRAPRFVQPTGVNSMLHRPDLQAFRCNAPI